METTRLGRRVRETWKEGILLQARVVKTEYLD
jgi:hypothetical protein